MYVIQKFSNFFNSYAKGFNKVYKRRGSLFLKNFKRKRIESEHQFLNTFFYIHLNPVKHGFVKNLFNWPYSSYLDYRDQKVNELLDKTDIPTRFASVEELKLAHEFRREIILSQNELE